MQAVIILFGVILLLTLLILILTLKLLSTTRRCRQETEEWKYLLGNIPDVVIRLDHEGIIRYMNPAGVLVFKESVADYTGKNLEEVMIMEGFRDINAGTIQNLMMARQAHILETSIDHHKSTNFLEFRIIPGPVAAIQPPVFSCQIRDITKRKQSETSMLEARQKAMESDKLKSAFLANMSHEIRTPLNAIVGFTQIILEENLTNEEKTRYFEYIYQNSNQLINLINDIIDLSKLESQQLTIREVATHLNQHLDEIREVVENEKKHREKSHLIVLVEKEFDDNHAEILTDPYRLRQIMLNLLINAIKFTPKGFIQFGYRRMQGNHLLFFVRDSGIGVEKEKAEEIFYYFRQLEQPLNKINSGTGLGLAICRNLVNLMGGKIWVESQPGKGSTFFFTLPYKKPVPVTG